MASGLLEGPGSEAVLSRAPLEALCQLATDAQPSRTAERTLKCCHKLEPAGPGDPRSNSAVAADALPREGAEGIMGGSGAADLGGH